jgi:hypothetical protein
MTDWDKLEQMLEVWVLASGLNFEQRQSLIPIRDFIFDRTTEGKPKAKEPDNAQLP